jgi:hypothetical protein
MMKSANKEATPESSQALTAMRMKMAVFWNFAPCRLLEVYRRFRSACCLHYHSDVVAASTSETSVKVYQTTRCNKLEAPRSATASSLQLLHPSWTQVF